MRSLSTIPLALLVWLGASGSASAITVTASRDAHWSDSSNPGSHDQTSTSLGAFDVLDVGPYQLDIHHSNIELTPGQLTVGSSFALYGGVTGSTTLDLSFSTDPLATAVSAELSLLGQMLGGAGATKFELVQDPGTASQHYFYDYPYAVPSFQATLALAAGHTYRLRASIESSGADVSLLLNFSVTETTSGSGGADVPEPSALALAAVAASALRLRGRRA